MSNNKTNKKSKNSFINSFAINEQDMLKAVEENSKSLQQSQLQGQISKQSKKGKNKKTNHYHEPKQTISLAEQLQSQEPSYGVKNNKNISGRIDVTIQKASLQAQSQKQGGKGKSSELLPSETKQKNPISQSQTANKISAELSELRTSISKLKQQQNIFKEQAHQKQSEIKEFLAKKQQQKHKRQQILKRQKQQQEERIKEQKKIEEIQRKRKNEQQLALMKHKEYIEPREKREKLKQQQYEKQQKVKEYFANRPKKQAFHIRKQRQSEQLQRQHKQQEAQILLERKKHFSTLNEEQLLEHQREFQQKKQQLLLQKRQVRQSQFNRILEANEELKDHIWRGKSHKFVVEELKQQKHQAKAAKQKVKLMRQYGSNVKQNNKKYKKSHPNNSNNPYDNPNKDIRQLSLRNHSVRYSISPEEIMGHYNPNKKLVKKYKYLQGKSLEPVYESIPVAKSTIEQHQLGDAYLNYLKGLPKKSAQTINQQEEQFTQIATDDLQMLKRKFNNITKIKRKTAPLYGRQSIEKKIPLSARPSHDEVRMIHDQLKTENLQLKSKRQLYKVMQSSSPSRNSQQNQKELNNQMLRNMEKKLELLSHL